METVRITPWPLRVPTAEGGVVHLARTVVMGEGVPTITQTHIILHHPTRTTTRATTAHLLSKVAMAVEGVVSSVSTHLFSQQSWHMGSRGRGRMQSYQVRCPFNCPHCPPRRQYPNPQPFTHSNRLPRDQGTPQHSQTSSSHHYTNTYANPTHSYTSNHHNTNQPTTSTAQNLHYQPQPQPVPRQRGTTNRCARFQPRRLRQLHVRRKLL